MTDEGIKVIELPQEQIDIILSKLNKQRCADLEARGLMTDAGQRALAIASHQQ